MIKRYVSILKKLFIFTIAVLSFSHMPLHAIEEGDGANPQTSITEEEKNNKEQKENEELSSTTSTNMPEESSENSNDEGAIDAEKEKDNRANTEEALKENIPIKSQIQNEKAIQGSDPIFPSKKEMEQEESSFLSTIEILKELEYAHMLFLKKQPIVAESNENKNIKLEDTIKKENIETTKKDEKVSDTTDENSNDGKKEVEENLFSEENFVIDDFDEDEESEEPFLSEDENFLTFDQEMEKESNERASISKDKTNSMLTDIVEKESEISNVLDEDDKVNISRYANILKDQAIDLSYPGEGWVYLGEENSKKGLEYKKRRMNDGKTFFTFKAEKEGNYVLNFSYFDVFSGDFLVDAVSVKVVANDNEVKKDTVVLEYQKKEERKAEAENEKKSPENMEIDGEKVGIKIESGKQANKAENTEQVQVNKQEPKPVEKQNIEPKSKDVKTEKKEEKIEGEREKVTDKSTAQKAQNSQYKEPEVFVNIATLTPENAIGKEDSESASKIMQEAQDAISQNDAKTALEKIENFFNISSSNIDVAYFLRGKAYELNGELKNMKQALSSYRFLTKTFPNSIHYEDAMRRIRYIEKYFINIK